MSPNISRSIFLLYLNIFSTGFKFSFLSFGIVLNNGTTTMGERFFKLVTEWNASFYWFCWKYKQVFKVKIPKLFPTAPAVRHALQVEVVILSTLSLYGKYTNSHYSILFYSIRVSLWSLLYPRDTPSRKNGGGAAVVLLPRPRKQSEFECFN